MDTPTGEAEEREAKEQLATVISGGGGEGGRLQLATVNETVSRQTGMERLLKDLCHPRAEMKKMVYGAVAYNPWLLNKNSRIALSNYPVFK